MYKAIYLIKKIGLNRFTLLSAGFALALFINAFYILFIDVIGFKMSISNEYKGNERKTNKKG